MRAVFDEVASEEAKQGKEQHAFLELLKLVPSGQDAKLIAQIDGAASNQWSSAPQYRARMVPRSCRADPLDEVSMRRIDTYARQGIA